MLKGFKRLGEVLSTAPELKEVRKRMKQGEVVIAFTELFPDILRFAQPLRASGKTLYIYAESAAWRSEIKFHEKNIIDKINKRLNEEVIEEIKFASVRPANL